MVLKWTGIPVSNGIAPTKVLAKVANRIAKKFPERTSGVYLIDSSNKKENALKRLNQEKKNMNQNTILKSTKENVHTRRRSDIQFSYICFIFHCQNLHFQFERLSRRERSVSIIVAQRERHLEKFLYFFEFHSIFIFFISFLFHQQPQPPPSHPCCCFCYYL